VAVVMVTPREVGAVRPLRETVTLRSSDEPDSRRVVSSPSRGKTESADRRHFCSDDLACGVDVQSDVVTLCIKSCRSIRQITEESSMDAILRWNQIALDVEKEDFSTPDPAIDPSPEQGGPTKASRALAIVHLAMYDAFVGPGATASTYLTYADPPPPPPTHPGTRRAAVATAAAETLIALFPRQRTAVLHQHAQHLASLGASGSLVNDGVEWGHRVALAMLDDRRNDGSDAPNTFYAPSSEPGRHRVDPQSPGQGFLGPQWGKVKPFGVAKLTTRFPGSPPPKLDSKAYADSFAEVKQKGALRGSTRTTAETTIGLFWAYDGPRGLGLPPRLYNQAVRAIAAQVGTTEEQNAKLFAMVNVAMADAGIQAWDEKYRYNVWRPVVGIREADEGWGPTGEGDKNSETAGDPYWLPLGAPRTNQPGKTSFTPPFPAYPSGHATFGAAALTVAAKFLALDPSFKFTFHSDELDGAALDNLDGSVRSAYAPPPMTIAEAIEENLRSRVFLGVHWSFDGTEGAANGALIGAEIAMTFPTHP
jgi:hypothetical protein